MCAPRQRKTKRQTHALKAETGMGGGTEVAHLCRRLSFLFEQLRPGCSMLKLIFHSDRKINTKFSLKNALLKVTEKSNREN